MSDALETFQKHRKTIAEDCEVDNLVWKFDNLFENRKLETQESTLHFLLKMLSEHLEKDLFHWKIFGQLACSDPESGQANAV